MTRSLSGSVGEKLPVPCGLIDTSMMSKKLISSAIGNIIIAAAITANGTIGSRHHIPFSIAARASMGFYFSYFAVVSRLVLGLVYFGYVFLIPRLDYADEQYQHHDWFFVHVHYAQVNLAIP